MAELRSGTQPVATFVPIETNVNQILLTLHFCCVIQLWLAPFYSVQ